MLATHIELATKLHEIERTQLDYGANIDDIWKAIDNSVELPLTPKRQIGFDPDSTHQNSN